MKTLFHKRTLGVISILTAIVAGALGIMFLGYSFAATNTNTTLGITAGVFSFSKDVGTDMDSYFSHSPSSSSSIDIGSYTASLSAIAAASSGDHRFTVSDMLGSSFAVTIASSALTASGVTSISASAVTYTGTSRLGTGMALTATGTPNTALNSPVTFVSRTNASGLSLFSQEITLKVAIPAAQAPASYTGQLTFTY